MTFPRFMYLLVAAVACPVCSGCVAIYTKKPIDVLVIDAETQEPINGANVSVSYGPKGIDLFWSFTFNKPDDLVATTKEDGQTHIRVANFGLVQWGVSAPNYLGRGTMRYDSHVPTEFQTDAEGGHDRKAVIRLYRQPEPSISVIVPDGYRGPLLIEKRRSNRWLQGEVGQRGFVFKANQRGYVGIDATPLLFDRGLFGGLSWLSIPMRYASGQSIPQVRGSTRDDAVAVRWLSCVGEKKGIFVVGTKSDEDELHSIIYHYIDGDPTHVRHDFEAINRLFDQARTGRSVTDHNIRSVRRR